MKIKHKYDKIESEQLDLLDKYYDVDHESHIVKFEIEKDKASDYYEDDNFGKRNYFSKKLTTEVISEMNSLPIGYKANLTIKANKIDSDPEVLKESFIDTLKHTNMNLLQTRKWRWLVHTSTLAFGAVIILINALMVTNQSWGDGMRETFWTQITAAIGGVFIWEAVTVLFIKPEENKRTGLVALKKLNHVRFIDANNNVLLQITRKEIEDSFEVEHLNYRFLRTNTVLIAAILMGYAIGHLAMLICSSINDHIDFISSPAIIVWSVILTSMSVFCSIVGYEIYLERGKLRKYAKFIFPAAWLVVDGALIYSHIVGHYGLRLSTIILLIVYSSFIIVNFISDLVAKKGHIK